MQIAALIGATVVVFLILTYLRKMMPPPIDPDGEILFMLTRLSEGLLYMSESDYPFVVVHNPETSHILNDYLPTKIVSLDDFFRHHTDTTHNSQQDAAAFFILQECLEDTLEDVKVYCYGEVQITAYILGKAPSGNYLGLKTTLIET